MNSLHRGVISWALFSLAVGFAAAPVKVDKEEEAAAKPAKNGFVFSLWPKSLQKNPRLEFNIITEMTAEGRKITPPTAEHPAYYVSQAGGTFNGGIGGSFDIKPPPREKLQAMMEKALAAGHYLPGEGADKQPTLAIVYNWGSHSFHPPADMPGLDADGNEISTSTVSEVELRKALLDRAMLLGGAKFAKEVATAMQEADSDTGLLPNASSPFDRMRMRINDGDRLVDELFSSSFFVVASAYDYAALAKGERRVLWRTKMTVNSLGVNMVESIPPLIASSGPYLGRETKDPMVLEKRISREGKVEAGTPTVVPETVTPIKPAQPAPANEKKE